jgi:two-component system, cell cycle response regulator DivK
MSQQRLGERKTSDTTGDEANAKARSLGPGKHLSVLIVDDVADTRELYEHYLHFRGIQVTTAADGVAALQAVGLERPDVIVLDLAMPRMTGWDVIRALKSDIRTRGIAIVALSGQGARQTALEAGADSYLEKPCLPDQLLAEVLRVLRDQSGRRRDH